MATNSQREPEEPPPSDQSGLAESTLGALLKTARESRGLTLQQVFAETRIPLRHLEALEHDRLGALPPGLYLRGEVRAYAKAVHLDPEVAVRMLDRALAPPVQDVRSPVSPPAPSAARPLRRPLVIGISMLLVVVVSTFVFWRRGTIPFASGTSNPQPGEMPASLASERDAPRATGPLASQPTQSPLEASSPSAISGAFPDQQRSDTVLVPEPTENPPTPTAIGEREAQLTVITEPPGARVTINGIGWGSTPATILHLSPGEKRIRVSLDGYEAVERVVDLGEAQSGKITVQLLRIQ